MRVYRLLLRLFPPAFRARFGDDMTELFADRRRRARAQGAPATARLWARTVVDLTAHGLAERRAAAAPSGRISMIESIAQDVRFALRSFWTRPAFTSIALVTLALGIGANTAIFSVVHAVLIRDLPYAHADRIVHVYETFRQNRGRGVANPFNYDTWERQATSFERLAATRSGQLTLTGAGEPERIAVHSVTEAFFDIVAMPPAHGRTITADDVRADRRVAVISHRLWAGRFGSDPAILGRALILDNEPYAIVGVLPDAFKIPERAEVWRPLRLTPETRANMTSWFLGVIGTLKPGVTIAEAQRELDLISSRLARQFPRERTDRGAWVVGLQEDIAFRSAALLKLLQGVVALVLLIACANVANLQLASASARRREMSIRASLGAGRGRLMRQLVTESVLLSVAGGAIGLGLAAWGVRVLVAMAPEFTLPAGAPVGINGAVLAFTFGLALAAGLLAGVAPAALFSSPAAGALRSTATVHTGGRFLQRTLRSALVASEVAISLVLIAASLLLVRSFVRVLSQDLGFVPDRVLTAQVTLPQQRYPDDTTQRAFWSVLLARLDALPGVTLAGASTALPFSNWEWQTWFEIRGRDHEKNDGSSIRTVTPGYFGTLAIPIRAGRGLSEADVAGAEPVVVVNEAFVRAHLSGVNPIGQRLRTDRDVEGARVTPHWMTIVGVAGDTRHTRLETPPQPEIYRPLAQSGAGSMIVALRTAIDPHEVEAVLRAEVRRLDPGLPLQQVRTMEDAIGRTTAQRRFQMSLLSLFAILAAVLAIVGTYGVMSYLAGLRRREVGIRLALGASPLSVKALLVRQGLRPVFLGIAVGVVGAFWGNTLLRPQLFEVQPRDPQTIAIAASAFVIVGAMACWIPARRASTANPVTVLHVE